MLNFQMYEKVKVVYGNGAINQLGELAKFMGATKALIVADAGMIATGTVDKVKHGLENENIPYVVYDKVTPNPQLASVEEAYDILVKEECDMVIGVGGGSNMDAAKGVNILRFNEGPLLQYANGAKHFECGSGLIMVPTTAGTGSEATQFTIITDTKKDIKMLLKGKVLMPKLAIIDPQFTMTAPPKITAATGLDALCHAVEAYTSRKAQTLSDSFAMSAVKRIFKSLPVAFKDGKNEEARIQMSVAALEAGIAFNNASVTIIHGMSRPIGALFHVAHGLSNAMLMKECLGFALEGAYDRFADLGRAIGVADATDEDKAAAEKFLSAIEGIVKELETPTLAEFGIDKEEFFKVIDKMAYDAMDSGSPQNTMREVSEEQVKQIYRNLW